MSSSVSNENVALCTMGVLMAPGSPTCGPCTALVSIPTGFFPFTGCPFLVAGAQVGMPLAMDGFGRHSLRSPHLERGPPVKPVPSSDVRRIMFVRPRFLGDVCLTLPAVDAALRACPQAQAAYVLEAGLAPLLAGDPRFANVITVPPRPTFAETL